MAELARWCRAQSLSETMTNAVIKAFVDLDSLRSCANDPGMVDEGLKEQNLPVALRMKVVAAVSALVAEPGAAPPPAEPAAEDGTTPEEAAAPSVYPLPPAVIEIEDTPSAIQVPANPLPGHPDMYVQSAHAEPSCWYPAAGVVMVGVKAPPAPPAHSIVGREDKEYPEPGFKIVIPDTTPPVDWQVATNPEPAQFAVQVAAPSFV